MDPTCLENYVLNKSKCLCEKKVSPPKKTSPKPKKTKKIVLKKPSPKKPSPKKPSPKKPSPAKLPSSKSNKANYCNNRNPQIDDEGFCPDDKPYYDNLSDCCYKTEQGEWHKKNNVKRVIKTRKNKGKSPEKKPSPKKTIKIKNTTPKEDLKLSKSLSRTITDSPPRTSELKSFTPEIKSLLQKPSTNIEKYDIMSNIMTPIVARLSPSDRSDKPSEDVAYNHGERQIEKLYNNPTITLKNGKIVKYNSKEAVDQLLTNLYSNNKIDCSKVIAPIQWQSNCWFNSGFMINYVSDKGRKFSQYLREAMITGIIKINKNETRKITPRLHKILFVFNLCIEASLSGNKFAYFMDTNFLIRKIYEAIPKKKAKLAKTNMPSNPTNYYFEIIDYLKGGAIGRPLKLDYQFIQNNSDLLNAFENQPFKTVNSYTDIIIIAIYDGNKVRVNKNEYGNSKHSGPSGNVTNKPLEYVTKTGVKYILDSVLVRDIGAGHFCSVLTCGGKEVGFDGESFHRMSPFEWKKLINTDQEWTFKGSATKWNFRNGYQELHYYRSDSTLKF